MNEQSRLADGSTSPLRGEVAPQAREGVGNSTSENVARPPHPGSLTRSDPPPQEEGVEALRHIRKPLPHDSGPKHVQGAAQYIDDIREPEGTLHVAIGQSPKARGRLISLNVSAVRAVPGVVAVLTAADIPGKNDVSPAFGDDPLFVDTQIGFLGQALFAVVATTRDTARRAVKKAVMEIESEAPSVTVEDALERGETVLPDYAYGRGYPDAVIAQASTKLEGQFRVGGQEHFYLEGQVALAIPGEDGDIHVYSSTQHPTEVQHVVARVLDIPDAYVTCETRRMGGGFGGKESQATQWAVTAALAARVTGRPCKLRLDRDDDFILTGKRHDFRCDWKVGVDEEGRIQGYAVDLLARCGYSADLSAGVVDRAMFHADNAYWMPAVHIASKRLKTNTVSNTAFRGFGGPQGMLAIEHVMDQIAWATGRDPLDVRYANFYRPGENVTPYGMEVEETDTLVNLVRTLEETSNYRARREEIAAFNASSPIMKRGLALTPVKFGISFTLTHMNQAGALVHVYQDGSVHLNHGGTEMGQGLYIKVAQVVAEEFGIAMERVRITATTTAKVPNTSPTAASSGSDLNGMAAKIAAGAIKKRMIAHASKAYGVPEEQIAFRDDRVFIGNESLSFDEMAKKCIAARVQLSEAGHYKTPKITWDRAKGTGRPFLYFAYGAACSEVIIDTLTGENRLLRTDILHDVGRSLNPAIDIGQIEGGFVQGMGWLTTEELVFAKDGRLLTHAPSTYKIPVVSDVPAAFNVALYPNTNREETIYRSKAVGEPPVMLANSVFCALADAIHALDPSQPVPLHAPATPEAILRACEALRGRPMG
ncbi:xanthine dehydrogenase molybdopterin binding subunit [Microvirga sp. CF3062]|uniref:xanthine dehydrogenase molybdopterin binding subunit n=1 Tax=Microvirga sp. CF3062 TaxID=3110182 RepID=UPI002E7735FE|nr:xanthine dehydrogenase molybdopterin binding subunit [Microvirga sp. CF3062]MEE1654909.1 xanthine dehydrogenase molybdopterin binding subunit [Microvirga sp. CF3062]